MPENVIQPENLTQFGAFLERLPGERARARIMARVWLTMFEHIANYTNGLDFDPHSAYNALEPSVARLLYTWSGEAADEFQRQAGYVEDFGGQLATRIAFDPGSLITIIDRIADDLHEADADYGRLKAKFDYWTGALANAIYALSHYFDQASAYSVALPAFPWEFSVYPFEDFLALGLVHRDLSVRVQDAGSGAARAVWLEGAISGGAATLTVRGSGAYDHSYTYQGPYDSKPIGSPAWGTDYRVIQDTVREKLRDPELYAAARQIVSGPGGLAERYGAITLPKPTDDSRLPSIARSGWPTHVSALGTVQSDVAPPVK